MADLHEVVFRWPHDGQRVILTGTFDKWSSTTELKRGPSGFEGTVRVPWSQKVAYKFIVDGTWRTTDEAPTEYDPIGNKNNVYYAPTKPASPTIIHELPMVAVVPPPRQPTPQATVAEKEAVLPAITNGTPVVPIIPQEESVTPPEQESLILPEEEVASPEVPEPEIETPKIDEPTSVEPELAEPHPTEEPVPAEIADEELTPILAPIPESVIPEEPHTPVSEPEVVAPAAVSQKISMPIVPVNDAELVSKLPVTVPEAAPEDLPLSTHAPINSARKASSGSIPVLPTEPEKKSTEAVSKDPASALPSPPTTPKKQASSLSKSESPSLSPKGSIRAKFGSSKSGTKTRRKSSFIVKIKEIFSHDKHDKDKDKVEK